MFFEYFKLGHFQKMTTESSNSEEEGKITGGNQNLIVEDDLREMGKKAIKTKTISPIQGYYVFVQLQALFSLISPITLIVGSIKAVSSQTDWYPDSSIQEAATTKSRINLGQRSVLTMRIRSRVIQGYLLIIQGRALPRARLLWIAHTSYWEWIITVKGSRLLQAYWGKVALLRGFLPTCLFKMVLFLFSFMIISFFCWGF